jgi:serine/threonine-protein kinase RsbW
MPCDPGVGQDAADAQSFRLVIPSDPLAVRAGLRQLMAAAVMQQLTPDGRGVAEIVLAEVLNNVVEHAYAEAAGEITLSVRREGGLLTCRVTDTGRPMPGGQPPDPGLTPPEQLPEGGFGWYLIRTLARDLRYLRHEGRNELCLSLADPA